MIPREDLTIVIDNDKHTMEDVLKLVRPFVPNTNLQNCIDAGDQIRSYVQGNFPVLHSSNNTFPKMFIGQIISQIDWTEIGRYYIEKAIEIG